jgi:hypothetical protein
MDRALACSWIAAVCMALTLPACASSIGSSCVQSTDCSPRGDRACDTSQPGGYCTEFGCGDKTCPDNGVCVTFAAALPGCSYNDYEAPARTQHTLCLAHCQQDSDCRTSEGYVCGDPKAAPWLGTIVDDNQNREACLVAASVASGALGPTPAACNAGRPSGDAQAVDSASTPDSGASDSAPEADTGAEDAAEGG